VRRVARAVRATGFTLVEVMIAVAIIGVIASLSFTNYRLYIERVRVARAIVELKGISLHLTSSKNEDRGLPVSLAAAALAKNDPWGRPYRYLRLASPPQATARKDQFLVPLNKDFDLYSLGVDGLSKAKITDTESLDDVVRGANGAFVGLARNY
jgi:general secretion pathway protein G